jgi:hypothetical protein
MGDDIKRGFQSETAYLRLKAVSRRLTDAAGGPVPAARITRIDAPRLSRCGSNFEAMFLPLDVISDLEVDTGEPIVSRELARQAGFVLVPAPVAGARLGATDIGCLVKESGDVVSGLVASLEGDNRVTAQDARRFDLLRQSEELVDIAMAIRNGIAALTEEDV